MKCAFLRTKYIQNQFCLKMGQIYTLIRFSFKNRQFQIRSHKNSNFLPSIEENWVFKFCKFHKITGNLDFCWVGNAIAQNLIFLLSIEEPQAFRLCKFYRKYRKFRFSVLNQSCFKMANFEHLHAFG